MVVSLERLHALRAWAVEILGVNWISRAGAPRGKKEERITTGKKGNNMN